ncbi:MAG: general secretion pathway protein D [Pirellulaceae bacterium]|jgi:general secretion pathway protein D
MLTCGLLISATQLGTIASANTLAVQTMLLTSTPSQLGFGTNGNENRQAAADYLNRARLAMKQKNFVQAEQLIQQAERLNVQYDSLAPGFQDTPAKVRSDLQRVGNAGSQLPSERYSILPFTQKSGPTARPRGPIAAVSQAGLLNTLTNDSKAKAANYLAKGTTALQQGSPEIALTWYQRAVAENATFGQGEYSPQHLAQSLSQAGIAPNRLTAVSRPAYPTAMPSDVRPTATDQIADQLSGDNRRSGFAAGNALFGTQQPNGTQLGGLGAIPTATTSDKPTTNRYLHMARRSLAEGNITAARQNIAEARKQGVIYQLDDDSPQKIEDLVQRGEQFLSFPSNGSASAALNKQYAQFLLAQADGLVRYREVELAKQMALHARNIPVQYTPGDRTPDNFLQQFAQSTVAVNAPVRLPQADASPIRPRTATNQFNVAPAVAQQPIGNPSNNVVQSVYNPQQDNSRNVQVQATQAYVPPNDYSLPAPNSQVNSGLDLYQQGLRLLEGQDRAGALGRFREAWKYEGELDPVTRRQLRDKLTLLQAAGSVRLPNIPTEELSPIDELSASQALLRENLLREITADQATAEKELKKDPRGANDRIQRLRTRVLQSTLDPASRKQLLVLVDRTSTNINRYIDENLADIELQERNSEVRGDIDRDRRIKLDVQNKLAELVDEFNDLMDEGRFEEAELTARKARELAPEEAVVKTLIWQSRFVRRFQEQMTIRDDKEGGFYTAMSNVNASSIPFDDNQPFQFDGARRWEELTRIRGNWLANKQDRLSDAEVKIQRALSEKVDVQFENQPLSQVIATLGQMVGINVFLDPKGLHAEGYTKDEPISLSLPQPISLRSVLNIILDARNLSYVIQNEVLMITSEQTRDMDVHVQTYYVADLVVPIPNFVPSYNIGLPAAIREAHLAQGGAGRLANAGRMPLTLAAGDDGSQNSVNPLALAQMQDGGSMNGSSTSSMGFGPGGMGGGAAAADFDTLIDLITSTIAPQSWDDVGGPGSIEGFPTNLSLVVAQTQEVHEQIADLLEQLRRLQDLQVTIEVRFITLNDNFFERIGIDFDFDVDDNSGLTNGNPTLPDDDGPSISIGLDPTGSPTLDLDYSFLQNSFGSTVPQFGGFDAGTAANFGFAILSDIEVFFLLQASQGDTRSNVLQAPKVTLFNGQQAFVSDTAQRPFVTSVIPVVGDFAAAQQPVIVVLSEGTSLSVQAVVSADRRFVRLTLVPFFSTIGAVEEFTFEGTTTTNSGTTVADPSNPAANVSNGASVTRSGTTVQLPTFAFTTVTTTVSVPDGGTVLLGGIKRLTEGRNERGVPMLSKLPYINRLFKNVGIGRTTQSLMLMVTPRIIIQEEEEEKLGIGTEL